MRHRQWRRFGVVLGLALAAGIGPAAAMLEPEPSPAPAASDTERALDRASEAVKGQRWQEAIRLLEPLVATQPRNADALNYLGFSYRKTGRYDEALRYYNRALEVDPDHLGANEYLGEAYLELSQPALAEERLRHLARICGEDCDAYRELKAALDAFRDGRAHQRSGY